MITREFAGDFVMYLYDNGFILDNRVGSKTFVQRKFRAFLQENKRTLGAYDNDTTLDQLLKDFNFVCNRIHDEKIYKFDLRALFTYRNQVIAQLEEKQRENANKAILDTEELNQNSYTSEKPQVLIDFPTYELMFRFRIQQTMKDSFILSSKGCYCCQLNFVIEDEYTAHIDSHSQESDFEYCSENKDKSLSQQFSVKYKLCEKSHLLFTIQSLSQKDDIIIEKIIVFRSGTIHYLEDGLVPYFLSSAGSTFYVNCHIFKIAYEQPLLIVFKSKDDPKGVRYVEEHHFLRFDVFPVNISLKTKHVFRRGEMVIKQKLGEYLPSHFPKILCQTDFNENDHPIPRTVRDYFKKTTQLNENNICDVFDFLVEMEDFALSYAYSKYSMKKSRIEGCASDYSVKITRPSDRSDENVLGSGDRVILESCVAKDKKGDPMKYFGFITNIVEERVYFEIKNGKIPVDLQYNIDFEPQRLNIQYQHRAMEMLRADIHLRARLFPSNSVLNLSTTPCLEYYNKSLTENPEQREAVQNIVENNNKHVPFIIFGPPGTGKTTVVVEAIFQLWKKSKKILVLAGSNAACDEIASRLLKVFNTIDPDGMHLLRIFAMSAEKRIENMNEDVLEASNLCYGQHFYPSLDTVYTYPIVIATLTIAGKLVHANIANNYFTHVFIDECGASTEPEAIVGLAGILSSSGHLILSGDPKQLGPIIKCERAANYGLDRSLLERLMECECYQQHILMKQYNKSIQSRLIRNFRSHKDILALSNHLYYDDELIAMAPPEVTDTCLGWSRLRTKTFPIVFQSVKGIMRKLKNSTSSCNYEEKDNVLLCIKELMFFGIKGRKIKQEDIGIVSPYKMQCQIIRRELDKLGWHQIATGSVETFQGQEKPIIIASMVRSRVKTPGFLDNPRRLNVLLTRAQSLLILVGNPDTLRQIGDWKHVIKYCIDNKALIGARPDGGDTDSNESDSTITESLQDLSLKDNRKAKNISNNWKHRPAKMNTTGNESKKPMKVKKGKGQPNDFPKKYKNQNAPNKKTDDQKSLEWLAALPDIGEVFGGSTVKMPNTKSGNTFKPKNSTKRHAMNVNKGNANVTPLMSVNPTGLKEGQKLYYETNSSNNFQGAANQMSRENMNTLQSMSSGYFSQSNANPPNVPFKYPQQNYVRGYSVNFNATQGFPSTQPHDNTSNATCREFKQDSIRGHNPNVKPLSNPSNFPPQSNDNKFQVNASQGISSSTSANVDAIRVNRSTQPHANTSNATSKDFKQNSGRGQNVNLDGIQWNANQGVFHSTSANAVSIRVNPSTQPQATTSSSTLEEFKQNSARGHNANFDGIRVNPVNPGANRMNPLNSSPGNNSHLTNQDKSITRPVNTNSKPLSIPNHPNLNSNPLQSNASQFQSNASPVIANSTPSASKKIAIKTEETGKMSTTSAGVQDWTYIRSLESNINSRSNNSGDSTTPSAQRLPHNFQQYSPKPPKKDNCVIC